MLDVRRETRVPAATAARATTYRRADRSVYILTCFRGCSQTGRVFTMARRAAAPRLCSALPRPGALGGTKRPYASETRLHRRNCAPNLRRFSGVAPQTARIIGCGAGFQHHNRSMSALQVGFSEPFVDQVSGRAPHRLKKAIRYRIQINNTNLWRVQADRPVAVSTPFRRACRQQTPVSERSPPCRSCMNDHDASCRTGAIMLHPVHIESPTAAGMPIVLIHIKQPGSDSCYSFPGR